MASIDKASLDEEQYSPSALTGASIFLVIGVPFRSMPLIGNQASAQLINASSDEFASLRGPTIGIPLVQLVMDYRKGDMAEGEVKQALCRFLPREWYMNFTSVNSFKTTETGFVVGQFALAPRTSDDPPLVLYVNCAPRKDLRKSRENNEGEGLVYGVLNNGVQIVAVNSKYSLSMVREEFVTLRAVLVDRGGSQFRSRDNFPPIVGAVAQGADLSRWLGQELNPEAVIPRFKEGFIGYIDSFGNIKTTYRRSSISLQDLREGQQVEVDINGTEELAYVTTGSFSVPEGKLAFAPGSSGWDNRFWEVFLRGGEAAQKFKYPAVGSKVEIKPLSQDLVEN